MVKARAAALGLGAKSALQGLKTHSEHFESVWWHFRVPFFIERVTCTGDVVIGFISIFRNGTSILGYRTSTAAAITIAGSKSDMSACFFFTEIAIRQIDLYCPSNLTIVATMVCVGGLGLYCLRNGGLIRCTTMLYQRGPDQISRA
jgi:hypothetical protein